MEKEIMNVKEMAEYLCIGRTSAYALVRRPDAKFAFKVGSDWRISKDSLDAWIKRQCGRCY